MPSRSTFDKKLKNYLEDGFSQALPGLNAIIAAAKMTLKMTPKIHPTRRSQMPSKSTWTSQIQSPNRLGPAKSTHALEIDLDQPNPLMPSKSTWTSQIHSCPRNRLGPAKSTHALEMSRSRNAHEISPSLHEISPSLHEISPS
jgi:hypothetical protein